MISSRRYLIIWIMLLSLFLPSVASAHDITMMFPVFYPFLLFFIICLFMVILRSRDRIRDIVIFLVLSFFALISISFAFSLLAMVFKYDIHHFRAYQYIHIIAANAIIEIPLAFIIYKIIKMSKD